MAKTSAAATTTTGGKNKKHKLQRPTPSTLSQWEHFSTLNDPVAQMRLARAIGYPPSWRVIRNIIQVPVPISLARRNGLSFTNYPDGGNGGGRGGGNGNNSGVVMVNTVQDRIYAGDPTTQPDGYYNHAAALMAASQHPWRPEYDDVIHDNNDDDYDDAEYCSTSHRNKGGQLKGREAKFEEGDVVEVLYDEDEEEEPCWYEATVLKKIEYQDDIRYNVHYTLDDAIQNDVREDKIRESAKTKRKKAAAAKKKASAAAAAGKKKGRKRAAPDEEEMEVETTKSPKKAKAKSKSSPKKGKAAVAAATTPKGNKRGRPPGSKNKKTEEEDEPVLNYTLDEGDPPWRTSGHEYLMRKIRYTPPPLEDGDDEDAPREPCVGKVVAWIADTDVDSEGNPGFECSKTGKPASLFHAVFEEFEQDFEEWELKDCVV